MTEISYDKSHFTTPLENLDPANVKDWQQALGFVVNALKEIFDKPGADGKFDGKMSDQEIIDGIAKVEDDAKYKVDKKLDTYEMASGLQMGMAMATAGLANKNISGEEKDRLMRLDKDCRAGFNFYRQYLSDK